MPVFFVLNDLEVILFAALVAWGICTAVAAGFGLLLGRDIVVMTRLVRALQINPADYPAETVLLVPGMRKLGAEALTAALE